MPVSCGDDDDVDGDDHHASDETSDYQTLVPLNEPHDSDNGDDRHCQNGSGAQSNERPSRAFVSSQECRCHRIEWSEVQH